MSKSKTINITLSIPPIYKIKFDKIKEKTHLSKSELLRRWIDNSLEANEINSANSDVEL